MTSRISVVVPVFNEAATIGRCLDSLQNQSRPADEIIIVNNNSTDDTIAIARRHHVTVIQESEQGIPAASHTGMNAATGDIIARCDADSILPADWLEKIESGLNDNPDAVAITGPGRFYDTNRVLGTLAQIWYMYAYFVLVGSAIAKWPLFGSNYAIKRDCWLLIQDTVHAHGTDIHDDIDVTMHLPNNAKVILSHKLTVGISARALRISNLRIRYQRGLHTVTLHWPDSSPYQRWRHKVLDKRNKTK